MNIDDFLEVNVEGYLLNDLENMANYRICTSSYGELGYPLIVSTIAGMELLGGLLSHNTFDKNKGDSYFREYWKNYLGQNTRYRNRENFIDIVYQLVRHGIAHGFIVKPGILIVKNNPQKHLSYQIENTTKALIIDAVEFYKDFKDSYCNHVKSDISNLKQNMQNRLNEMICCYQTQSNNLFNNLSSSIQPTQSSISSIKPVSGIIQ